MGRQSVILSTVVWVASAGCVLADAEQLDPLQVTPSAEAYASAIRFQGIDLDVRYFDPTQAAPSFEAEETVVAPPPESDAADGSAGRWLWGADAGWVETFVLALMTMIVVVVAYLLVKFGGGLPVAFSSDPEDGSIEGGTRLSAKKRGRAPPRGLQAILRIKDREVALVALCKSLLERVVTAEGVLLQRSWTDRDSLRRVPRDHPHRADLQALVFASERVQFGGRTVTEDEFKAHVERLMPLWTRASA